MIAGAEAVLDQPIALQTEVGGGVIGVFVWVPKQGFDGEVACFHNTPRVSKTSSSLQLPVVGTPVAQ